MADLPNQSNETPLVAVVMGSTSDWETMEHADRVLTAFPLLAVEDVSAYPKRGAKALLESGRAFEELKQAEKAKQQYAVVVEKYKELPEAKLATERLAALKQSAAAAQ